MVIRSNDMWKPRFTGRNQWCWCKFPSSLQSIKATRCNKRKKLYFKGFLSEYFNVYLIHIYTLVPRGSSNFPHAALGGTVSSSGKGEYLHIIEFTLIVLFIIHFIFTAHLSGMFWWRKGSSSSIRHNDDLVWATSISKLRWYKRHSNAPIKYCTKLSLSWISRWNRFSSADFARRANSRASKTRQITAILETWYSVTNIKIS